MSARLAATVCLLSAIQLGCASYTYTDAPSAMGGVYSKYAVIGYGGNLRPLKEVGVVTTDGLVKIKELDGQPVSNYRVFSSSGFYSGGRYQLHLLPGSHTVIMGFHDNRGNGSISWSTSDITRTLQIDRGQVIHFSLQQDGRAWGVKETDGSGALEAISKDYLELAAVK